MCYSNLKNILSKNNLYVVAVSGGPDSMFLLDSMRIGGYKFIVAHVNYHKRIDSDYDENLVWDYCQKYSLTHEIYSVKKDEYPPLANFQAWARQIRYDFFRSIARKNQTRFMVVAHHQQDHLETYCWQKSRQSLVDYWGLPISTQQEKFWIFRPLLSLTKEQIIQYLHDRKISYAVDSTNQLPIYQRNILRTQIANLKIAERARLLQEIQDKNQELRKIKLLVNQQKKYFCSSQFIFHLITTNLPSEVYLRLLYYWINQATNGLLLHRKKKLLNEVYKQLFLSPKNNLTINLGDNWEIIKNSSQAIIRNTKKSSC